MIIIIQIDKNNGIPIYIQVKQQIKELIRTGDLKLGQKMLAERELSEQLKVSRNTVSTAYKELELEGVLKSFQGKGTFIAEEAKPWQEQNLEEKILKFVDLGLEEALEAGIDAEKFLQIVIKRVNEKKEMMKQIKAVYVECNIEQAKMFSKELSLLMDMDVKPITINELKAMDQGTIDKLQNSQAIITTFNHVTEVSELTKSYNKKIFGVAINADLNTIVKIARFPEGTKFAFMCISDEFKFKVHEALEGAGLGEIDIIYSNTKDQSEVSNLIDNSDVIIVSPGRYKDVAKLNYNNKEIINFLYILDEGSVKALKSKIVEVKIQN